MRKYIEISEEALMRLVESGNCVKGALHRDEWTGKLYFKAYSRKPQIKHKDVLVKKLPWGWIKESLERIKVFGSFPKDMGTAGVMGLLEEHNRDAKNALIERELDIIEFC